MHGNENLTKLSNGYFMRPAALDDVEVVTAVLNACSVEQIGKNEWEASQRSVEWDCPSFNLKTDTRVVEDSLGTVVAYADVYDQPPHVRLYSFGRVHPAHRGRGIGSALCCWLAERAGQAIGAAPEGSRVSLLQFMLASDTVVDALMDSQGYRPARYNYQMILELDGPPPQPILPPGVAIRPYRPEEEAELLLRAIRDEFRDHWGYVEVPWERAWADYQHWVANDPEYDPSLWLVAVDAKGMIVGTALGLNRVPEDPDMGWINDLGVRRPWRRRGIALALLRYAFGEFGRRGKERVGLGVDAASLTGATRLYEKAGMHVLRTYVMYEKELRPGVELSTQAVA